MASFSCWDVRLLGGEPAELQLSDDGLRLTSSTTGVPAEDVALRGLRSWGYEEKTELVTLHTKVRRSGGTVSFRSASAQVIGKRCAKHPDAGSDAASTAASTGGVVAALVAAVESTGGVAAEVTVSFEGAGSLGLALLQEAGGRVLIEAVLPGTLAAAMPQLHAGMVLRTFQHAEVVERQSTDGRPYREVLGMLKATPRPLLLGFDEASQPTAASWSVTLGAEPAELRLSDDAVALIIGLESVARREITVPLRELRSWDCADATELITLRTWSQPGTVSFRAVSAVGYARRSGSVAGRGPPPADCADPSTAACAPELPRLLQRPACGAMHRRRRR